MKKSRSFIAGVLAVTLLMLGTSYLSAATLTVSNTNDSGLGSLRDAIAQAKNGDTIVFDPSIDGKPIVLNSTLEPDTGITITGNGPSQTIIDGNTHCTVFDIPQASTVTLQNITVQNGYSGASGVGISIAGGIINNGTLTIKNSFIQKNFQADYFDEPIVCCGIANCGNLVLTDCTIALNECNYDAQQITAGMQSAISNASNCLLTMTRTIVIGNVGGIYNAGIAALINSTVMQNSGFVYGGIYNAGSELTITSCTISGNLAQTYESTINYSGGIYNAAGANLSMSNTVCADNKNQDFCLSQPEDEENQENPNITDIGYNIVGGSCNYEWEDPTDWIQNSYIDNFERNDGTDSGPLLLADRPTYNGGSNFTLGLDPDRPAKSTSIVTGNGNPSQAGQVDQRGYIRKSAPDIGAYETNGIVAYIGSTPYSSIQDAINAANPKSTIELIPAQIKESGINVNKNVTIEGQGADSTHVQAYLLIPGISVSITDRIFNVTSDANLKNMTIRYGGGTDGQGGGGILNNGSNLSINNCAVSYNTDTQRGGGICNNGGSLVITKSTLIGNNIVNSTGSEGGGIYNSNNGTLAIDNVTISNSDGKNYGGAISNYGALTVNNSTITGCHAIFNGDAINSSGIFTIFNSTISGNGADPGTTCVIYNSAPGSSIISSTISGNDRGITNNSNLYLLNSIVVNNNVFDINTKTDTDTNTGSTVSNYSWYNIVLGTPPTGTGNQTIPYNPGDLGPLQNNGGLTQTMALNNRTIAIAGIGVGTYGNPINYAFSKDGQTWYSKDGSQLPSTTQVQQITTDQRGYTFPTWPDAKVFSMGAYSVQAKPSTK